MFCYGIRILAVFECGICDRTCGKDQQRQAYAAVADRHVRRIHGHAVRIDERRIGHGVPEVRTQQEDRTGEVDAGRDSHDEPGPASLIRVSCNECEKDQRNQRRDVDRRPGRDATNVDHVRIGKGLLDLDHEVDGADDSQDGDDEDPCCTLRGLYGRTIHAPPVHRILSDATMSILTASGDSPMLVPSESRMHGSPLSRILCNAPDTSPSEDTVRDVVGPDVLTSIATDPPPPIATYEASSGTSFSDRLRMSMRIDESVLSVLRSSFVPGSDKGRDTSADIETSTVLMM